MSNFHEIETKQTARGDAATRGWLSFDSNLTPTDTYKTDTAARKFRDTDENETDSRHALLRDAPPLLKSLRCFLRSSRICAS